MSAPGPAHMFSRCLKYFYPSASRWLFKIKANGNTVVCVRTVVRQAETAETSDNVNVSSPESESASAGVAVRKISKAMKAYIERAQQHEKFMKEQLAEYEIGKRHLANIMGYDSELMTQDDIDKAIEYLFPSGIFSKRARPIMKHPSEIFPKQKAAQFSLDGRPYHYLFYTIQPNYYTIMHDLSNHLQKLDKFEDRMLQKGIVRPEPETELDLSGTEWQDQKTLCQKILEEIDEFRYKRYIVLLDRLSKHPYAYRIKDVIMGHRVSMEASSKTVDILPLLEDESGTRYVETTSKRKTSISRVIVKDGSGTITINDVPLDRYFLEIDSLQHREQILFPLQFTDLLGKLDVQAYVNSGGPTGQSGSIRHALSLALCSFVDKDVVERMRLVGLLTRDIRRKERKKPGQPGARKKATWKKR